MRLIYFRFWGWLHSIQFRLHVYRVNTQAPLTEIHLVPVVVPDGKDKGFVFALCQFDAAELLPHNRVCRENNVSVTCLFMWCQWMRSHAIGTSYILAAGMKCHCTCQWICLKCLGYLQSTVCTYTCRINSPWNSCMDWLINQMITDMNMSTIHMHVQSNVLVPPLNPIWSPLNSSSTPCSASPRVSW